MGKFITTIICGFATAAILANGYSEPSGSDEPEHASEPVKNFVPTATLSRKFIEISAPNTMSEVRKDLLAGMLADVADKMFLGDEQKSFWFALLARESRFDGRAKSPVGAVGLGQLMPKFKAAFGETCGMSKVTDADLMDDYTNAFLSACYFKALLAVHSGSIPLALVAYNAGNHGTTMKNAKTGAAMNNETSNYVSQVWIHHERATNEKEQRADN